MRKIIILFMFIVFVVSDDSLDILLNNIKSDTMNIQELDNKRVKKFLQQKSINLQLLQQSQEELKKQKQITVKLKNRIDKNRKILTYLKTKLKFKTGELGEIFGVVRQTGGEFKVLAQKSLTSAYLPNRDKQLEEILDTKKLPDIKSLRILWYLMQQEIIQSGKIETKKLQVINQDGTVENKDVTIIGLFNATSDGKFLKYYPQNNYFISLSSQPPNSFINIAKNFEQSSKLTKAVIDPTKGKLLDIFAQKPSLSQRLMQGGFIGFVILFLGFFGIIIAIWRYIVVFKINNLVQIQLKNINKPTKTNPLGRLLMIFDNYKNIDLILFEAKLQEAISKEIPKIKRFENTLKLIATISPLLGLLGTVTGMIETFGAITLFGTGDPKLMASGISQALMTTVLGLVVAIVVLFLYTFISSFSSRIIAILDEQSAGLIVKKMELA